MHEALVAHRSGDLALAKTRYHRALKLEPKIKGAKTNLAAIALRRDETELALKELQAELDIRGDDPDAKLVKALAFLRTDRVDKALEDIKEIARLGGGLPPDTVSGYTRRATAQLLVAAGRLMQAGDATEGDAIVAVWDALNPVLNLDIASMAKAKADAPKDALEGLKRQARRLGGLLALTSGEHQRGLELLAVDATEKRKAPYPILRLYGLVALGRSKEALTLAEKAEAGPLKDSPWAKVLRGYALASLGRHGEIPKVVAGLGTDVSQPASLRAAALRLMASAHTKRGAWDEVVTALLAAGTALGAKNVPPELWLDQAVALAHVGRIQEAKRAIAGVLRDQPSHKRGKTLEALLK